MFCCFPRPLLFAVCLCCVDSGVTQFTWMCCRRYVPGKQNNYPLLGCHYILNCYCLACIVCVLSGAHKMMIYSSQTRGYCFLLYPAIIMFISMQHMFSLIQCGVIHSRLLLILYFIQIRHTDDFPLTGTRLVSTVYFTLRLFVWTLCFQF